MLLGWEDAQRLGLAPSHLGGIFDAFKPKKTRTPDVPVSSAEKKERVAASVFGASVGMLLGPVGVAPGYAIGGRIADSILGKKRKKKQRAIDQVRADEAQQALDAAQRQEDDRLRQRHEAQQEAQARRREEVEAEQIRRKAEREDLEAQRQADREEREERRRQALERSREIREQLRQRREEQLEAVRQAAESTRLPVRDSIQEDDVQTETWGDFWQSVGLGSLGDRDSDPVAEARYQHARETERARLAEKDRQAAQRRADAEKARQEEEARRAAHEAWLRGGGPEGAKHQGGEPWTRPIPSGDRPGASAQSQSEEGGFFDTILGVIHGIDETFSPNMGPNWQTPQTTLAPLPPGTKGTGQGAPPGQAWSSWADRYDPTLETRPLRRLSDNSPDYESTLSPADLAQRRADQARRAAEKQAERDRAADLARRQADLERARAQREAESRQRAADMARAARERQAELERQLAARNRPASVSAPRRRAPAAPANVWWPEIAQAAQVSRSLSQSIQAGEALAATAQPAEFGAPQVPTWTPAPAPSAPAGTYTMPWGPTSAPVMAPPISWLPQPASQQAKPATQATQAQQYVFRPGGMTQADSQRAYAALRAGGAVGVHGLVDELTPGQTILVGAVAGVATVALACAVARRFA